jgi:hypothetical protein
MTPLPRKLFMQRYPDECQDTATTQSLRTTVAQPTRTRNAASTTTSTSTRATNLPVRTGNPPGKVTNPLARTFDPPARTTNPPAAQSAQRLGSSRLPLATPSRPPVQQRKPPKQETKPAKPRGARVATLTDVISQNQSGGECGIVPLATCSQTVPGPSQTVSGPSQIQTRTNFASVGRTLDGRTVASPVQPPATSQMDSHRVMTRTPNNRMGNGGATQQVRSGNNTGRHLADGMGSEQTGQATQNWHMIDLTCSRGRPARGNQEIGPRFHMGPHHLGPRIYFYWNSPEPFIVNFPTPPWQLQQFSTWQINRLRKYCSMSTLEAFQAGRQPPELQEHYDLGLVTPDEVRHFDGLKRDTLNIINRMLRLPDNAGSGPQGGRRLG